MNTDLLLGIVIVLLTITAILHACLLRQLRMRCDGLRKRIDNVQCWQMDCQDLGKIADTNRP